MASAKKLGKARGRLLALAEELRQENLRQARQDQLEERAYRRQLAEQARKERLEERDYKRKQEEQARKEQAALRAAQLKLQAMRLANMGGGGARAGKPSGGAKQSGASGGVSGGADLNRAKAYNAEVTPESVNSTAEELYGKNAFTPEEIQAITAAYKQQVISNPENPVGLEAFLGRKARQKGLTSVYDLSGYRKAQVSDEQTGNKGDRWYTPWSNGEMRSYRQKNAGIYDSQKALYDRVVKGLTDLTYTTNDAAFFTNPELVRAFAKYYNAGNTESNAAAMASVEAYARANRLDPKPLMERLQKPGEFQKFRNTAMQYGLTRAAAGLASEPETAGNGAGTSGNGQRGAEAAQGQPPGMVQAFDPEKYRRNLETAAQVRQRIKDLRYQRERVAGMNPPDMHNSPFNEQQRLDRIRREQQRIDGEIAKAEGWLERHAGGRGPAAAAKGPNTAVNNGAQAARIEPRAVPAENGGGGGQSSSGNRPGGTRRRVYANRINGMPAAQAIAEKKQAVAEAVRREEAERRAEELRQAEAATADYIAGRQNPALVRWTNPQFNSPAAEAAARQELMNRERAAALRKQEEEDRAFESRTPASQWMYYGNGRIADSEYRNWRAAREQWKKEMLESGADPQKVDAEMRDVHLNELKSGYHLPPVRSLLSPEDYQKYRTEFDARENRIRSIYAKPFDSWTPEEKQEMDAFVESQRGVFSNRYPATPQQRLREARAEAGGALHNFGPEKADLYRKGYGLTEEGTSPDRKQGWSPEDEIGFLSWLEREDRKRRDEMTYRHPELTRR